MKNIKQYNCPDFHCPRIYGINTINTYDDLNLDWSKLNINTYTAIIPDACKHCATHPSNGGDGMCWCILGSINITC